jgi:hypothetical protein
VYWSVCYLVIIMGTVAVSNQEARVMKRVVMKQRKTNTLICQTKTSHMKYVSCCNSAANILRSCYNELIVFLLVPRLLRSFQRLAIATIQNISQTCYKFFKQRVTDVKFSNSV